MSQALIIVKNQTVIELNKIKTQTKETIKYFYNNFNIVD